jgi:hypothetical protein
MVRLLAPLVGLALLILPATAEAQYFGRNKVQYEHFDFKVLQTDHFDVYFYPNEREAADIASRMAERWYTRLSTVMRHQLRGRQPLILYATAPQFRQTNVVDNLGEGTGGVTEALRRRIVLPIGGTLGDLNHVIGHELTHAFQYDMTGRTGAEARGAVPAAASLPLWFIEGMAEYMSLGPNAPETAMWMRGGLEDTLPSFRQLDDPRFFPYRYGHALLAYVAGRWGDQMMGDLLRASIRTRDVGQAIRGDLAITPDQLVQEWHEATAQAYEHLEDHTEPADSVGVRLVKAGNGTHGDGSYNIGPALSPDGDRFMFLSDRDLFSIDLFLADGRTGKVDRQITRTAVNPHFQSLQFIESAGSWQADGRRFVFAGIAGGRPILTLYDADRHRTIREIRLRTLGEALTPSWSPDGRRIAFTAVNGGLTDLYYYDLEADSLHRLTHDAYADLQPVWSPDGRTLAFATDRFGTSLDSLKLAPYALALMDVESGRITRVAAFPGVRQLNPQWSPDGRALYFLADPLGITNVYRTELATGRITQITNLFTGVAGITATSPALTVAQHSGRLMFSLFRSKGYDIYAVDAPSRLAGETVVASLPGSPGVLPPADRTSVLAGLLNDAERGLPPAGGEVAHPYNAGLSLTYVGQPSIVAGSSGFGTYVGGGAALYWSDLLGNRSLTTGLQVNGGIRDVTALVAYQNFGSRWNWGVLAQQVPYVTGGFAEGTGVVNGEPALIEQQVLDRQTNRDLQGTLAYPFSDVQRVEFSAGASHISFDREVKTDAFSLFDGQQIASDRQNLEAASPLTLGTSSAALVYDNSIFGATGPILGQRYRLEASPTFGSISYVGVLADWRRYFMLKRPFTLAARLMHYGRYGSGGEDPRFQPLFLGYPGLVRGYRYGSFSGSECNPPPGSPNSCPVFDQLLGSRIAVANLELRFPLFGVLHIGSGYYGMLPLDWTIFGDAGMAWNSGDSPSLSSGDRTPVFSAGTGFRFNLFGYAVAEVNLVHPFDRPGKNWLWEFNLQPGF